LLYQGKDFFSSEFFWAQNFPYICEIIEETFLGDFDLQSYRALMRFEAGAFCRHALQFHGGYIAIAVKATAGRKE
jgi:hypothetical protein